MRTIQFVAIASIVAQLLSCDPGAYPPRAYTGPLKHIQGDWDFDEDETFAQMGKAKSIDEIKNSLKFASQMKQAGLKLHADITVKGGTIVGRGQMLMPSYEVLSAKLVNGKTVATVRWHEDMQDPGDMSNVTLVLWCNDTHLMMAIGDDDDAIANPYCFVRPGAKNSQ